MPRLLLVDDNPSIHKIAETLLATSDVQLVSCASGADAMDKVNKGELFDVALLDTSMMGMDGWALLQKLRETASTARMPVAMMAGVLDIVDPERLRLAPIQGFLKKPVELRDLGERIKRLLETPVPAAEVPAPPVADEALFSTQPSIRIPDALRVSDPEEDLLILTKEDLFPEQDPEAAEAAEPASSMEELDEFVTPAELAGPELQEAPAAAMEELGALSLDSEPLDLEELDLEGLRGLTFTSTLEEPAEPALPEPAPAALAEDPGFTIPEFLLTDTLEPAEDASPAFAGDLPDLGAAPTAVEPEASDPLQAQADLMGFDEPIDWSDDSDAMVAVALSDQQPAPFAPEPRAMDGIQDAITLSDILDPPPAIPDVPALDQTDAWLAEIEAGGSEPSAAASPAPELPADLGLAQSDLWPTELEIEPADALPAPALDPEPLTEESIAQADLWPMEAESEPALALSTSAPAPEPATEASVTQEDLWPMGFGTEPAEAPSASAPAPEPGTEASLIQADLWPAELETDSADSLPALAPEPATEPSLIQADLWPTELETEPADSLPVPVLEPEPAPEPPPAQADLWPAERVHETAEPLSASALATEGATEAPLTQADLWPTELDSETEEAPAAMAAEPALPPGPDPLSVLLADPVLMDRLARALVARMGDQVLREIAWEVIPELAERFQPSEKQ